jgi:hypothetical protein
MHEKKFPYKGYRFRRLIVTSCKQGTGAPIIDDAWTNDREGNTYSSKCIVWPFGNKNQYGERLHRHGLVIGWRKT